MCGIEARVSPAAARPLYSALQIPSLQRSVLPESVHFPASASGRTRSHQPRDAGLDLGHPPAEWALALLAASVLPIPELRPPRAGSEEARLLVAGEDAEKPAAGVARPRGTRDREGPDESRRSTGHPINPTRSRARLSARTDAISMLRCLPSWRGKDRASRVLLVSGYGCCATRFNVSSRRSPAGVLSGTRGTDIADCRRIAGITTMSLNRGRTAQFGVTVRWASGC
ncbi:hypothetical protein C8Q77DRAFT_434267 [Trametes polyzona]|nr:hypothetical protein C8Q77DRAFT_434267 [Trametes polyzona]